VALRVMECVVVGCGGGAPAALGFCGSVGVTDAVVGGVVEPTTDVLLLLNGLELLERLAASPAGLTLLRHRPDVLPRIRALASHPDPSVAGFALRFMGRFSARGEAEGAVACAAWFPAAALTLLQAEATDPDTLQTALETVGSMATTQAGLSTLLADSAACERLGALAAFAPREVRTAALHAIAVPVDAPTAPDPLLQRLVAGLFDGSAGIPRYEALLAASRTFDRDVRLGALHLLHALAGRRWGALRLARTPGFLAWLTDRSNEADKEALEYKFGIGQRMHAFVTDLSEAIGAPATMDLRAFVRLGPFFNGDRLAAAMPAELDER
jgi:hypothetical protein